MNTILNAVDDIIQQHIVFYLVHYGKYDVCLNQDVANIQLSKPRCASGCACELSRTWRTNTLEKLHELEIASSDRTSRRQGSN